MRESYEAKAQVEFAEIEVQLIRLASRAQGAAAGARVESERLFTAAQSRHDEALRHFELLKRASEDSWHSIKAGFEAAWTELRAALAASR